MHQQQTDIEKETMDINIDRTGGGIKKNPLRSF